MNHSEITRDIERRKPACTREQAAELLEALRAEHQALPRWLVASVLEAVVRGTGQAATAQALVERRQHPRSEFGLAAIENVAYAVLRKTDVTREVPAY